VKTKKTTPKVGGASRNSATESTETTSEGAKAATQSTAYDHCLPTKLQLLPTESENDQFTDLIRILEEALRPVGELERLQLEDVAICWWKIQIAEALETRELARLRARDSNVSEILDVVLRPTSVKMPINSPILSIDSEAWEISQLVVSAAGHDGDGHSSSWNDRVSGVIKETGVPVRRLNGANAGSNSSKELGFHAVLGRSLERHARYNGALRREFSKSLELFYRMQEARRKDKKRVRREFVPALA
jgi:hypothetical protein